MKSVPFRNQIRWIMHDSFWIMERNTCHTVMFALFSHKSGTGWLKIMLLTEQTESKKWMIADYNSCSAGTSFHEHLFEKTQIRSLTEIWRCWFMSANTLHLITAKYSCVCVCVCWLPAFCHTFTFQSHDLLLISKEAYVCFWCPICLFQIQDHLISIFFFIYFSLRCTFKRIKTTVWNPCFAFARKSTLF